MIAFRDRAVSRPRQIVVASPAPAAALSGPSEGSRVVVAASVVGDGAEITSAGADDRGWVIVPEGGLGD